MSSQKFLPIIFLQTVVSWRHDQFCSSMICSRAYCRVNSSRWKIEIEFLMLVIFNLPTRRMFFINCCYYPRNLEQSIMYKICPKYMSPRASSLSWKWDGQKQEAFELWSSEISLSEWVRLTRFHQDARWKWYIVR